MKKNEKKFRRVLALVLAVALVATSGMFSSGNWLRATDEADGFEELAASTEQELTVEAVEQLDISDPASEEGTEPESTEAVSTETESGQTDLTPAETETPAEQPENGGGGAPQEGTAENVGTETEETETQEPAGEVKFPAAVFEQTADNGVKVTVSSPDGAFPEGTVMQAAALEDQKALELMGKALSAGEEAVSAKGVDITFYSASGEAVQPRIPVSVRLEAGALTGEVFRVFHETADGTVEVAADNVAMEAAEFSAGNFSAYVVGGIKRLVQAEEPVEDDNTVKGDPTPETPDTQEEPDNTASEEPELEEPVATYRFFVNDALLEDATQYLKNGESLQLPAAPDAGANAVFSGWYAAGDVQVTSGPVRVTEETTIDVHAKYDPYFYVTFQSNGIILATAKAVSGQPLGGEVFATAAANYEPEADKVLAGWVKETDGTPFGADTPVNEDTVLVPVTADCHWVTFDSRGGSYVGMRQVGGDGKVETPEAPVRTGYTFKGWFEAPEGGSAVDLNTKTFAASATLYAQWTAKQVGYTVIYWEENANYQNPYLDEDMQDPERYSFKKLERKTGTAGTAPNLTPASNGKGFKAGRVESKALAGDGTTIVNVYYDREVYQVLFYVKPFTCKKEAHEHKYDRTEKRGGFFGTTYYIGGCYPPEGAKRGQTKCGKEEHEHSSRCYGSSYQVDDKLTITAKYGANISSAWPGNDWKVSESGSTFQTNLFAMPLNGAKFYQKDAASKYSSAYYYVEVLPGETGTEYAGKYKLHHTDTSSGSGYQVSDEDRYDIDGYTCNTELSPNNKEGWDDAKFYYDRNSYKIHYMVDGLDAKQVTKKFEEPIGGASHTPDKSGYEFGGWYLDEACTKSADSVLSGTMPSRDITVYAKWIAPQFTVKIHVNVKIDGEFVEQSYDFTVNAGDLLDESVLNEKAGITEEDMADFLGWYTKEGDVWHAFNFSQPINSDVSLYVRKRGERFAVTYDITANAAAGCVAPVDTGRYASGASAKILSGSGLTTADGKVFDH